MFVVKLFGFRRQLAARVKRFFNQNFGGPRHRALIASSNALDRRADHWRHIGDHFYRLVVVLHGFAFLQKALPWPNAGGAL